MKQEESFLGQHWSPQLGKVNIISKSKTKWKFSWKKIVRPFIFLVIYSIAIITWNGIYWGIGLTILILLLEEVALFKQHGGLLEIVDTKEVLPLFEDNLWGKINIGLYVGLIIIGIFDIFIILSHFGLI